MNGQLLASARHALIELAVYAFIVTLVIVATTVLAYCHIVRSDTVVSVYSTALGFAGAGAVQQVRHRMRPEDGVS